jgi:ribosomal protein L35
MVGSYRYFAYKNGRLITKRSYHIHLHNKNENHEYRHFGKKRLVRPMYKKGLHRFSKPWKHYQPFSTIPRQFKSLLPCGYSSNQLWIGLCRAWNAFTIWKQKNDIEMMRTYGRIIHKLQKKLGLLPTEFDIYIGDD